jgi:8-oxo-dGTP diphosphatase
MNPEDGTGPGWAGFVGAKAALFCGLRVLTLHRDNLPGLPWANHWDLPGGGREGDETPEACLLRELEEEFGLSLPPSRLTRRWIIPSMTDPARPAAFFAGTITAEEIAAIRFGSEGQGWQMMEVQAYLSHPLAIPAMQARLRLALG